MRLIDADALKKTMWRESYPIRTEYLGLDRGMCTEAIENVINAAPTIDPESIRPKGHYLTRRVYDSNYGEHVTLYRCSECGLSDDFEYRFCPYCGADMRGESE